VKDFISFAAVKFNKVKDLLHAIKDRKWRQEIQVTWKVIKKSWLEMNEWRKIVIPL
jgi:hypothetical protein